jgi:hypothetical protein
MLSTQYGSGTDRSAGSVDVQVCAAAATQDLSISSAPWTTTSDQLGSVGLALRAFLRIVETERVAGGELIGLAARRRRRLERRTLVP